MEPPAPRSGGRPWSSVLARTALVATLVPQLGILWILHRPSPTRVPAALVAAVTGRLLEGAALDVERATIDRRGEVRLEGLRLGHTPSGVAFLGEARVSPSWSRLLAPFPDPPRITARGRLTELRADGVGATLAEDVVIRAGSPEGPTVELASRVGGVRLRVVSHTMGLLPRRPVAAARAGTAPDWRAWLREAGRLEGGAEIVISGDVWQAEIAARGGNSPSDSWRLGALEGWVADDTGDLIGWVRAEGACLGELSADVIRGHVWPGTASLAVEGGRWGTLDGLRGAGTLVATRDATRARIALSAGDSAARVRLIDPAGDPGWQIEGFSGVLRAQEILRLPRAAEALRRAEIDLSGGVELADATVETKDGALVAAQGWFAVRGAGWKDIRPSIIRPERPTAALRGHARVDLAAGTFAATSLDLAGLAGSIEGGLVAGSPYVVRLASTPGNPVHPGCLDSLLGDWWVDLWRRFDLSTGGACPHADVVVRGKWGALVADEVEVGATLERFGFMGARFLDTAVRVKACPASTVVHIDRLTGELDGKAAGAARGMVTWDWAAGQVAPDIRAEGDLHPLVALRLQEGGAEQAARLRGAQFGEPYLKVAIPPKGPTTVNLTTRGESDILGARLGPLELDFTMDPRKAGLIQVAGTSELAGGRITLELEGDLGSRNRVSSLKAERLQWAKLPRALPFLLEEPAQGEPSEAILDGSFSGQLALGAHAVAEGEGTFSLKDSQLRRVQLFGVLSQGLDALGLGFSGYDLTEATGEFRIKDRMATLPRLTIGGEDAELNLAGQVNLQTGGLRLIGDFRLKDSHWGPFRILNPNLLFTKVIKIKIGGTLAKPETKVGVGF